MLPTSNPLKSLSEFKCTCLWSELHLKFIVQMYDKRSRFAKVGVAAFRGWGSPASCVLGSVKQLRLVSLEYNSAFQDTAHLALSLQYILQCTCSPSAVPERFCKRRRLSPWMYFPHLQLSFLSPTLYSLMTVTWKPSKGSKKACL